MLISVRAPVGSTNISSEKCAIGRGLAAIRCLDGIDSFFVLYLLRSLEKTWRGTGTTFDAIGGDNLRDLRIAVPPLDEQRRIKRKIDELFTKLDAGIEALKNAKTRLKQYRQSILKDAFEGKLTARWREENKTKLQPASKLLAELKAARQELNGLGKSKFPSTYPPFGIPESWVWTTIGSIFDVGGGGTPRRERAEYWEGDIPWVSSGEVAFCNIIRTKEKITELGVQNSSAKVRPPGTVLVALFGEGKTRGQAAILRINAATNQAIASILCNDSVIPSEYVYWWLYRRYNDTRRVKAGMNQPNMYLRDVKAMQIPLAPLEEQRQVIERIERDLSNIEEIERMVDYATKQSVTLRAAILQSAFSGKLLPQNSNDEPAIILLKRVQDEKARLRSKVKEGNLSRSIQ